MAKIGALRMVSLTGAVSVGVNITPNIVTRIEPESRPTISNIV